MNLRPGNALLPQEPKKRQIFSLRNRGMDQPSPLHFSCLPDFCCDHSHTHHLLDGCPCLGVEIVRMKRPINIPKTDGFTMIETIVVLFIMAIVASFVLFRPSTSANELVAEAEILKSHLRYAQIKAMNGDTGETWGIHLADANNYILYKNNAQATDILPGETAQTHTFPTEVSVTSGVATVNFDNWGSPVSGTQTITLKQGTESSSITITKNTGYIQ